MFVRQFVLMEWFHARQLKNKIQRDSTITYYPTFFVNDKQNAAQITHLPWEN